MKESFIFYGSFLNAIEQFSDKSQVRLYKVLCNFALKGKDFSSILSKKELAIFELIKPQILANNKRYEVGKKCASFGKLGGRPKKEKNPKGFLEETPNVNVNDNDNVNVNVNEEGFLKEKNLDPFIDNLVIKKFQDEYFKHFNCKAFLTSQQRQKIMGLNADIPGFIDVIPEAIERLRKLDFKDLPNFTPTANWLLKDNNLTALMNGAFEEKKSDFERYFETMEN